MDDEKRVRTFSDRRARRRGGRRNGDSAKPWYLRHAWWLAAVSAMFVNWKRIRRLV